MKYPCERTTVYKQQKIALLVIDWHDNQFKEIYCDKDLLHHIRVKTVARIWETTHVLMAQYVKMAAGTGTGWREGRNWLKELDRMGHGFE